ncbi:MAG: AsmA family protein [Pseudomonadales bacterium]
MKKLLIFIGVLVALLAVVAAGLLWALKDPNRFKPELQSLIKQSTGMDIALDGDLSWQLWPPVVLKGADIRFEDEETAYRLGAVGVKANLMSLITGGGALEIDQLRVDDLQMTDKRFGDLTVVETLRLDNFSPGVASPLYVRARLESEDTPPSTVVVEGPLAFFPNEDRLTLKPMAFDYDGIRGTCDVAASRLTAEPSIAAQETKDDLLPLDTFRAMHWLADCKVPEFSSEGTTLRNITVRSENKAARSTNKITIPDALGGSVTADVAIDTSKRTPRWIVKTNANELQSQELMNMVAPSLKWVAPLLAGGELQMRGNTPQALVDSMSGSMQFDSKLGQIDISAIKEAVLGIAQLAGKGDKVSAWPQLLGYEDLAGQWRVQGTQQDLAFTMDNIAIASKGLLNALTGELDMRSSVTINRHPTLDLLPISDDLYGLPIPMRCTGTTEAPDCSLDSEAARKTLTAMATSKARGKVDEKLNEAIEDKVPEEYRETAKEALKGLGNIFGGKNEDD